MKNDNPIHRLMEIEAEVVSEDKVGAVYRSIAQILQIIRDEYEYQTMPDRDKPMLVRIAVKDVGYRFGETEDCLITMNVDEGILCCLSFSIIAMAVAHELGWPLHLVLVPRHALLRWYDPQGESFYVNGGLYMTDSEFIDRYKVTCDDGRCRGWREVMRGADLESFFYHNTGVQYKYYDDYENAIGMLTRALDLSPDNPISYWQRADCYNQLEHYVEAIDDYTAAIDHRFKDGAVYIGRSMSLANVGRYDDAISDCDTALEMDYKDMKKEWFHLATLYCEKECHDEAIKYYTLDIEEDPEEPVTYNNRGLSYYGVEDYDSAMADFNQAIELNNEYSTPYYSRSLVMARMGLYEDAYRERKIALDLDPMGTFWYIIRYKDNLPFKYRFKLIMKGLRYIHRIVLKERNYEYYLKCKKGSSISLGALTTYYPFDSDDMFNLFVSNNAKDILSRLSSISKEEQLNIFDDTHEERQVKAIIERAVENSGTLYAYRSDEDSLVKLLYKDTAHSEKYRGRRFTLDYFGVGDFLYDGDAIQRLKYGICDLMKRYLLKCLY